MVGARRDDLEYFFKGVAHGQYGGYEVSGN
jgi:hypothetical protein